MKEMNKSIKRLMLARSRTIALDQRDMDCVESMNQDMALAAEILTLLIAENCSFDEIVTASLTNFVIAAHTELVLNTEVYPAMKSAGIYDDVMETLRDTYREEIAEHFDEFMSMIDDADDGTLKTAQKLSPDVNETINTLREMRKSGAQRSQMLDKGADYLVAIRKVSLDTDWGTLIESALEELRRRYPHRSDKFIFRDFYGFYLKRRIIHTIRAPFEKIRNMREKKEWERMEDDINNDNISYS